MKGLAESPDDAAEWAGRKPDCKALTMAALQRAISHADPDARAAALFATREAVAKEASSQVRSEAGRWRPGRWRQGRWRQHGSQHGLVLQSSRQ